MRLLLVCLCMLSILGCPGGMVVEVSIEHRVRCTLVKHLGGWRLTPLETAVTIDECKQALERVLLEWEQTR